MQAARRCEVWFVAGSQDLYGEAALAQVDADAREVAAALDGAAAVPVRVVLRGVATTAEAIRRLCLEANADDACVGVIAWMHTFSPAKMWIAGLSALRKPLLHLHTQFNRALPWAEIDMDFMNTHQSAHGDREFGFMQTPHAAAAQGRRRPLARPGGARADRPLGARGVRLARVLSGCASRASATTCARSPSPRATRSRRRCGSASRSTATASAISPTRSTPLPASAVDELIADYERRYELVAGAARAAARGASSLRDAARIEAGLRAFLEAGGFGAFTDTFEDLHGLRQLPGIAVQRLMADGYGFGAEGDWKTAALVRILKVMATGLDGGTSFMEDYTYDLEPGRAAGAGRAYARDLPVDRRRDAVVRDPPALDRRPRGSRCGSCSTPRRARRSSSPCSTSATASACSSTRSRSCRRRTRCRNCRWPARCGDRRRTSPRPPRRGCAPAARTTPSSRAALEVETIADFAQIAGIELLVIDAETTDARVRNELRWNDAALPARTRALKRAACRCGASR